ncbi:hypothetical protein LAUMK191_00773 [Mycobacterium attenuatum]|nr:hypothetical protein LAUMK191_00773 [Mycobacterium attenuatum]
MGVNQIVADVLPPTVHATAGIAKFARLAETQRDGPHTWWTAFVTVTAGYRQLTPANCHNNGCHEHWYLNRGRDDVAENI